MLEFKELPCWVNTWSCPVFGQAVGTAAFPLHRHLPCWVMLVHSRHTALCAGGILLWYHGDLHWRDTTVSAYLENKGHWKLNPSYGLFFLLRDLQKRKKNSTCGNFMLCLVIFLSFISVNGNSSLAMSNQSIKIFDFVWVFFVLKWRMYFYPVCSWEMWNTQFLTQALWQHCCTVGEWDSRWCREWWVL